MVTAEKDEAQKEWVVCQGHLTIENEAGICPYQSNPRAQAPTHWALFLV